MISTARDRGVVLEESLVRVVETGELGFDLFGEAVVEHVVGRGWRGEGVGVRVGGEVDGAGEVVGEGAEGFEGAVGEREEVA